MSIGCPLYIEGVHREMSIRHRGRPSDTECASDIEGFTIALTVTVHLTLSLLLQSRRGENVKVPVMDTGVPLQLVGGALKSKAGSYGIGTSI